MRSFLPLRTTPFALAPSMAFAAAFAAVSCFAPAATALAQERVFELTIENHRFDKELLEVKAGEKFKIKVKNKDKNFEEFESNSLVIEKFLKPGAEVLVNVGPLKAGEYEYFAEFHQATGKGKIVVRP